MKTFLLVKGVALLLLLGTASAEQYIQVDYSSEVIDRIANHTPGVDKEFLVINITITNFGYEHVGATIGDFQVMAHHLYHMYDTSTYSLDEIDKPMLDGGILQDGERASGHVAFEIPAGTTYWKLIYWDGDPNQMVRYNDAKALLGSGLYF